MKMAQGPISNITLPSTVYQGEHILQGKISFGNNNYYSKQSPNSIQ